VAFSETNDHLGLAIGDTTQRIRLDKTSLRLSLDAVDSSMSALVPAVEGTWAQIRPANPTFGRYSGAWSHPLVGDYETLRTKFATRCIGGALDPALGVAFDAAALINIRSPLGEIDIEYGVVTAHELAERVADSDIGLLGTTSDDRPGQVVDESSLPPVSAFYDFRVTPRRRVSSADAVISLFSEIESTASRLVSQVSTTL
jgi:hypothetical protein